MKAIDIDNIGCLEPFLPESTFEIGSLCNSIVPQIGHLVPKSSYTPNNISYLKLLTKMVHCNISSSSVGTGQKTHPVVLETHLDSVVDIDRAESVDLV